MGGAIISVEAHSEKEAHTILEAHTSRKPKS